MLILVLVVVVVMHAVILVALHEVDMCLLRLCNLNPNAYHVCFLM